MEGGAGEGDWGWWGGSLVSWGRGWGWFFFEGSFCERFASLGFGLRMAGFVGSGAVSGYDDSGFGL